MKRCWIPAGFLYLLVASCTEQPVRPTLPEAEMARIMGDLAIADAAAGNFTGYQKDSLSQVYYGQVFEMHHTTLADYEKNLRIYANDLDKMERISKQVEERFNPEKK